MATLAEIGYSIKNQVSGFVISDDSPIDIYLIYHMIRQYRSTLIKEEFLQLKRISEALYQQCHCLEIKCREIDCDGESSGQIQNYVELPPLEQSDGYANIKYFGSVNGKDPYYRRSYQGFLYNEESEYTPHNKTFTIVGNEAILNKLPSKSAKYITMVAILEDPLKCKTKKCDSLTVDDQYPIPSHMITKIEMLVTKQLNLGLGNTPDPINDATGVQFQNTQQTQKSR